MLRTIKITVITSIVLLNIGIGFLATNYSVKLLEKYLLKELAGYEIKISKLKGNLFNLAAAKISFKLDDNYIEIKNLILEHNIADLLLLKLRPSNLAAQIIIPKEQLFIDINQQQAKTKLYLQYLNKKCSFVGKNNNIYKSIKLYSKNFHIGNTPLSSKLLVTTNYNNSVIKINSNLYSLKKLGLFDIQDVSKEELKTSELEAVLTFNKEQGTIKTNLHLNQLIIPTDIAMLNLKNLHFSIDGDLDNAKTQGQLLINGTSARAYGNIKLKENIGADITLKSNNLALDNDDSSVILDLNLNAKYNYIKNLLDINGRVDFEGGEIKYITSDSTNTLISPDVEIIDISNKASDSNNLKINTKILLHTKNPINIILAKIQSNLSSDLWISSKSDGRTEAKGKLNLKAGKIKLLGKYYDIEHANITYPKFGPFSQPYVDIKLIKKDTEAEYGLLLQGPISQLLITPFSSLDISEDQIYSKLGLSIVNLPQLAALSLSIFDQNSVSKFDNFTEKLGIELETQEREYSDGSTDTEFVINKKITDKFFLQYSQGLFIDDSSLKLLYKLNSKWNLGISSEEGSFGINVDFAHARN